MYEIVIKKSADKDLKKLPIEVYAMVRELILSLADNPRPFGVETMTNYGKMKALSGKSK